MPFCLTVEFSPHPNPDVYHHFNVYLCKQPGIRSDLRFNQLDWNCFGDDFAYEPELPNGTICESDELPMFASFDNNEHNIGLRLPDGFGFKTGGDTGYNYVVMATHYPEVRRLENGRTGLSELTLRLVPGHQNRETKRVGLFNLSAWGFIPPRSVTSMNGSYVYDQSVPMTPIAILAHTHSRGLDFEFWLTSEDGKKFLVWKQDPNRDMFFHIPPHPLPAIRDGQTLTLRCVFNNTLPSKLVIQ